MNTEYYNWKVLSKNSKRLLKNLQNTTRDYAIRFAVITTETTDQIRLGDLYVILCYRTAHGTDYWLGLRKPQASTDGDTCCEWVDGNPSTYRNWMSGNPDIANEICVRMTSNGNGRYNDKNCGVNYRYVCKVKGIIALKLITYSFQRCFTVVDSRLQDSSLRHFLSQSFTLYITEPV